MQELQTFGKICMKFRRSVLKIWTTTVNWAIENSFRFSESFFYIARVVSSGVGLFIDF